MNKMFEILYMAWRYLLYHKVKSAILVVSITLIIYLPVGLKVVVDQSAESLTVRAESTPLIVGAKGSPLELVLNTLYFESDVPMTVLYGECTRISDDGLATGIPVYTRFRSGTHPIVGTTLEYFEFRGLKVAQGRNISMLGECVLGATAAKRMGVGPGKSVISSPETVFDITGVYPLKMNVVGVLQPMKTPDDQAVFVDLETAWVIEGLGHGHEDLSQPEDSPTILHYNNITQENVESFHFHGNRDNFPITAVIVEPRDEKSSALLRGKYLVDNERLQIVEPMHVMDKLLDTIFTVQSYVIMGVMVVGFSTLTTAVLVFLLSLRLRSREIETMHRIGGSKLRVTMILSAEIVMVLVVSVVLAAVLTSLTNQFGGAVIRILIF